MLLYVLHAGVQVLAPRNAAITAKSSLMDTGGAPSAHTASSASSQPDRMETAERTNHAS